MSEKYADKTIDLRGLHGTEVEIRTKIEIDRLTISGNRLRVLHDDPGSHEVISRLIQRTGHLELISTYGSAGGTFEFLIERK
jgi:TusA-related sulfurtransferase